MNARERVSEVLAGRPPDRPPVSFWHHFPATQIAGHASVEAHLNMRERYDLDFLKVMADVPYPHEAPIQTIDDLEALQPLRGDEAGFGQQLEVLAALQKRLNHRVFLTTTVFNAWMILRLLIETPKEYLPPNLDAYADRPSAWIRDALARDPRRVGKALNLIGENLARFAARCVRAGSDGIFLSVRDDWVDVAQRAHTSLYNNWVEPTDRGILAAVSSASFNIVHVCGCAVDFARFASYPVSVLHWADRAAGPAIRNVAAWAKPALAGGIDNLGTLVHGTPECVREEVRDALVQAGDRPLIIAPGCTFDPARVPEANLQALVRAARE